MKKIFCFVLLVITVNFVFAKEVLVRIIDKNLEIPLEGVKIQVRDNKVFNYTDAKGYAKIKVDDKDKNVVLTFSLTGYNATRYLLKDTESDIVIKMTMEDVIEGKELVVEREKIGEKDEELGISTVVDQNQLNSTAKIGQIEDVMSTIKMLPGVSFSGNYNAQLSVRGGNPDELTCLYDGFLILFPYHWGGAYSIFNPNAVDSVKFSPGIFNVKNGQAISALLEVNSIYPDKGFKIDTTIATNTVEILAQVPLGKTSGLFVGGRFLSSSLALLVYNALLNASPELQQGISFPIAPYLGDGYLKWYWKPNERFEWFADGLFACDGIDFNYNSAFDPKSKSPIKSLVDFFYYNYDAVGFTGFKILPTDKIFINFVAGYEYYDNGFRAKTVDSGKKKYSDDFVDYINDMYFPGMLQYGDRFTIDDLTSRYTMDTAVHSIQSKLDVDFTLTDKVTLSVGTGASYDFTFFSGNGNVYSLQGNEYKRIKFDVNQENKQDLKSFIYLNFVFNILPDTLKIDTGCRLDHVIYYILDQGETFNYDTYHMTTYPVPQPRFNLTYSPVRNLAWLDKLSFSAGVGLFSKIPTSETQLTKELGLKDFQILMPEALSTVLGTEWDFPLGFRFKLEGYYKYYFNDFYVNTKTSSAGMKYYVHSDGIGHVAGFDLMLERRISRYIDGWVSYSFIFAGYKNPQADGLDTNSMSVSDPRGIWYYPGYQRFHTLNIVLNIRPLSWFTITTSFTFATGTPKADYTGKVMFPAILEDGTIVEMYHRNTVYSPVLRTNVSFPWNLKFTFNTYLGKSKVRFEAYIAVEDIFAPIEAYCMPYDNIKTNMYTGKDQRSPSGSYAMPFPQPSAGITFSF